MNLASPSPSQLLSNQGGAGLSESDLLNSGVDEDTLLEQINEQAKAAQRANQTFRETMAQFFGEAQKNFFGNAYRT